MGRQARDEHIIEESRDKWRYACPNGHRSWTAHAAAFYCPECARSSWPQSGWIETLVDERTGETVRRSDLDFRRPFWFLRGES